jgi:hypothetical protein
MWLVGAVTMEGKEEARALTREARCSNVYIFSILPIQVSSPTKDEAYR